MSTPRNVDLDSFNSFRDIVSGEMDDLKNNLFQSQESIRKALSEQSDKLSEFIINSRIEANVAAGVNKIMQPNRDALERTLRRSPLLEPSTPATTTSAIQDGNDRIGRLETMMERLLERMPINIPSVSQPVSNNHNVAFTFPTTIGSNVPPVSNAESPSATASSFNPGYTNMLNLAGHYQEGPLPNNSGRTDPRRLSSQFLPASENNEFLKLENVRGFSHNLNDTDPSKAIEFFRLFSRYCNRHARSLQYVHYCSLWLMNLMISQNPDVLDEDIFMTLTNREFLSLFEKLCRPLTQEIFCLYWNEHVGQRLTFPDNYVFSVTDFPAIQEKITDTLKAQMDIYTLLTAQPVLGATPAMSNLEPLDRRPTLTSLFWSVWKPDMKIMITNGWTKKPTDFKELHQLVTKSWHKIYTDGMAHVALETRIRSLNGIKPTLSNSVSFSPGAASRRVETPGSRSNQRPTSIPTANSNRNNDFARRPTYGPKLHQMTNEVQDDEGSEDVSSDFQGHTQDEFDDGGNAPDGNTQDDFDRGDEDQMLSYVAGSSDSSFNPANLPCRRYIEGKCKGVCQYSHDNELVKARVAELKKFYADWPASRAVVLAKQTPFSSTSQGPGSAVKTGWGVKKA